MSENNFEKKKSKNLLFFNEAVEYFSRFYKSDLNFNQNSSDLNPNQLRDEMLDELNNLREIIAKHPDTIFEKLSEIEKKKCRRFFKFYSVCPICGDLNHYFNLKKFYFDEESTQIRDKLIRFMDIEIDNKKLKNFNLDIGIPCCKCFKTYF